MKELTLKELQGHILEIMLDIDAFCRENGIRYSLAYGTLLGAIRHRGFIPWDDDIDIVMPRPDYDRFLKTYRSGRFRLLADACGKDEFYRLKFAKVHDPQTKLGLDSRKSRFSYGVFVDIFPMEALPADKSLWDGFIRRAVKLHHRLYFRHKKFPFGSPLPMIEAYLHSYGYWREKCDAAVRGCDFGEASHLCHIFGSDEIVFVPKDWFDNLTEVCFEGHRLLAFAEYGKYLEDTFGDYMTLPPEKDRKGHGTKAFKL